MADVERSPLYREIVVWRLSRRLRLELLLQGQPATCAWFDILQAAIVGHDWDFT
jgi:hypothetical protein